MGANLGPGQEIAAGGQLTAPNNRSRLVMQGDGNLVLYRARGGEALWASNTVGTGANRAIMQDDGNFVLYSNQGAVWATGSDGNPGAMIQIQDDANLVVYSAAGGVLWATNTSFLPMRATADWQQSAMHMRASAVLTAQGQLRVDVRTWCTWVAKGFTGGCAVLVVDSNENIIHDWIVGSFGVDGTGVFWKRSSRTDSLRTNIPEDIPGRADYLLVACSHMPRDRFKEIIDEARDKAQYAKDAIGAFNIF